MGIKKPSKSKLKRLEKRKALQEEQEPTEAVEQAIVEEEVEDDDEEAPIAVPLDDEAEESEDDQEDEDEESEEELEEELVDQTQRPKREKRQPINNEAELQRLTEEIKLKNLPWIETLTVTSSEPLVIEDIKDDMARELAFYQQALEAAQIARDKIIDAGVPFSRPDDYFAEMIKSDEHMAKIRQRLVNEDARVKAAEDAKLQRKLKKFGKKVQVERQLQRQKEKSETLEKIKLLKRKRKDGGGDLTTNDDFDIALESATTPNKKQKTGGKMEKSKKRQSKDAKYGMGGRKRNKKSNTAASSAELGGYNKMKGKPLYLGKGKKSKN
ncbi:hypothetical protein O0I10_006955 [Lichtheimia ornata]|uniref:Uncharacterized protein n=1 Tax=Lichtheimia ornata TaxID=688661 RepID=A0AAD7V165_9FUNG|nr:uncharacterized protein O0I10_006955 [Lichtheimia ornata]KAJ8657399.1 hypothetical protein O0I10_006955 [Lichtheimia ornata]